jgi:hypothetical protein
VKGVVLGVAPFRQYRDPFEIAVPRSSQAFSGWLREETRRVQSKPLDERVDVYVLPIGLGLPEEPTS